MAMSTMDGGGEVCEWMRTRWDENEFQPKWHGVSDVIVKIAHTQTMARGLFPSRLGLLGGAKTKKRETTRHGACHEKFC